VATETHVAFCSSVDRSHAGHLRDVGLVLQPATGLEPKEGERDSILADSRHWFARALQAVPASRA